MGPMTRGKMIDFSKPILDAAEHLRWVFGKLQGYRALAFLDRETGRMSERFYEPRKFHQMCLDIKQAGDHTEVFYCPLPMATADRWKGNASSRWMVWIDVDTRLSRDLYDTLRAWGFWLITSGTPGNVHAYARMNRNLSEGEHRGIQEALRDKFGGDNKIADNDLLRVAGTMNYKNHPNVPADKRNDRPYPVAIEYRGKWSINAEKLIARLGVTAHASASPTIGLTTWAQVAMPDKIPGPVRVLMRETSEGEDSGRYRRCMAAVSIVLEHGFTRNEAHVILDKYDPGVDKFGFRWHKEIDRLWLKRMDRVGDHKYQVMGNVSDGSAILKKVTTGQVLEEWTGEAGFWNARTVLTHVYRYAKAHQLPPWGLLGAVLARVATAIPAPVRLPDNGTVNMLVGLVGLPGDGKGRSISHADRVVLLDTAIREIALGSGQGIVHQYKREKAGVIESLASAVLFVAPEIDKMAAHTKGQGATLDAELRLAWSGEPLGGAYSTEGKRIVLDRGTYRLCAIVGVQPERAGVVMGGVAGGLPQRFLWFPAYGGMERESKPWRGMELALPEIEGEITYCDTIYQAIAEERWKRDNDRKWAAANVIGSHDMYNRAKIACVLSVMDGRGATNDEDWELAGMVMDVSCRERDGLLDALKSAVEREARSRGRVRGIENVVMTRVEDQAGINSCKSKIVKRLQRGNCLRSLLQQACGRTKTHFDDALGELISEGKVVETKDGRGTHYRLP
jgi:hypothetical protein